MVCERKTIIEVREVETQTFYLNVNEGNTVVLSHMKQLVNQAFLQFRKVLFESHMYLFNFKQLG